MTGQIRLGVNVDHVATLRNARGGVHPDPVTLAKLAVEAGADGITMHLREDRRHIRDADVERLMTQVSAPLNFEMACTAEMLGIALRLKPHAACLVPEKREERTTEGGLDVIGQKAQVAPVVKELVAAGVRVSLFVEADPEALEQSALMGAPVVELHTGTWCEALGAGDAAAAEKEFARLKSGATLAKSLGLEVHAGHGLDYASAETISTLPEIAELNIGHYLMGEALGVGLPETIRLMKAAMARGAAKKGGGMILGLGNDLCDIRRIEQTLERFGDRFLNRVYTETERKRAFAKADPANTLAKRFAAKEACAKALGTGFRAGTFWRDMGVTNLPSGRPTMTLTGGAKEHLDAMVPEGYEARIDVTLTDEPPLASAVVIISATPKK